MITPPLVTARGLSLSYRHGRASRTVLHDIDLEITGAGITAITGPSGSGKSSLLFCLAGLETAEDGAVQLLGSDPARTGPRRMARLYREQVGFVFQDYNLIPYLSARRNVELPGLLARRRSTTRQAMAVLEELGMAEHADTAAMHLSGGQQQRVALARVMAQRPEVLFADEPTGALDSGTTAVVLAALQARAESGAAVVLVTHDREAAARASRVVTLRDGRITGEEAR